MCIAGDRLHRLDMYLAHYLSRETRNFVTGKRTVESHKRGASRCDVPSFIKRRERKRKGRGRERKRSGERKRDEPVSKLKFASGNPWQRVRANRFHFHRVSRSPTLSSTRASERAFRLYLLSPTSKSQKLTSQLSGAINRSSSSISLRNRSVSCQIRSSKSDIA